MAFHLRAVRLSNDAALEFVPGEIVLVVGPNNAGKSTFLRDIHTALRQHDLPRKMLIEVDFEILRQQIEQRLRKVYNLQEMDHQWFVLNKEGTWDFGVDTSHMTRESLRLGRAAEAFAILLNAETRLSLSNPVETLDVRLGRPTHPYHQFLLSRDLLRKFALVVKDAFGLDFTITRIGNPIRGYVGRDFQNELDSLEADQAIPSQGEPINQQGDGIRSYVGIAAEIVGSSHPIVLLDEPEAFLHPPQAKKLGRTIIGSLQTDRQCFIATHSSDFLQGVLTSRSDRVSVVRLDRSSGTLLSNSLGNDELQLALAHPSLANSNLLDSLFFSQTVICEGDSDCGLLDWSVRELGSDALRSIDRFWFAAGGKQQTPKIAELLNTFGVDFRVVLDLDAITDWKLLERLTLLKGGDISGYKSRIAAALRVFDRPALNDLPKEILSLLEGKEFSSEAEEQQAMRGVARVLEKARRSQPLKQYGMNAFRKGQERADAEALVTYLQQIGFQLLRKGEIESYVPDVGLHGPGWASVVQEDLSKNEKDLRSLLSDLEPALI